MSSKSIIFNFFDKKSKESGIVTNEPNYQLANELHKPIDLFSKYTWAIPIKDKKGASIVNVFKKIISKERKPKKNIG